MSQIPTEASVAREEGRRVQAQVALVLLETLKSQDRPGEILDDEDVTLTIPRRLGLSGVVDAQIRRYREEVRQRGTISEQEVVDLLRLVTRRPDSEDVFVRIGRSLTAATEAPRWRRILPRRFAYSMARRRVRRRLRTLFGGPILEVVEAPFVLEAAHDVFMKGDPGGEACGVITGISQAILETAGIDARVEHLECRSRRDDRCRWGVVAADENGNSEETDEPAGEPSVEGKGD